MRLPFLLLPVVLFGAAGVKAEESTAGPDVQLSKAKLIGGRVEGLEEALEKTRDLVAMCVATHGGLVGDAGRLDVQLLVRDRGRAEGVEVGRAQHVSEDAVTCVRKLLKNRFIGTPTNDPVGVHYVYKLLKR